MNKRIAGVVVLLVVGGFAGWRWYQAAPDIAVVAPNPALTAAHSRQSVAPVLTVPRSASTPVQAKGKTLEIAKAYYASKDLRAFAEMAKKRPQEGGATYAFNAINICIDIQKIPDIKASDYTDAVLFGKKQSALNDLRYRCQGFLSKELTQQGLSELSKSMSDAKDLLAQKRDGYFQTMGGLAQEKAPSAEQRQKLLIDLADLQDPDTIARFGIGASVYFNEKNELSFWVSGETYATRERRALIEDAWSWASCYLGVDCGANSLILLTRCASDSKCFDSIDLYYRDKYATQPGIFEQLIILRDVIVNAFRTRDFSKLVRP
ncbi:hypothetical protein [Undibacterium luofuense]|uniref:Uncharacterized protein n=1 Tax=Undibacterium luofuense TaxID=2828733 RepID=A0A941DKS9_9BURK|nr:hypothetical protein [Undibacterium luofuense]MBR7782653.1 hypothetical protein [Undibacterium luofuense]